jgi:putative ABC transport system ATP-binding protein
VSSALALETAPRAASPALAELDRVSKRYAVGPQWLEVLREVSLRIAPGDFLAVMGPSGAGKSTLLHVLGCLERPSSGNVRLEGLAVEALDDRTLSRLRNTRVGFVFQAFHLIPRLTVLENVEVPLLYARVPAAESRRRARDVVASVGLAERAHHAPAELSGGERQRAAIARALVNDPALILADEPTGNLDARTGGEIMELLSRLNGEGRAVVVVTHNDGVAASARRTVRMRDGRIDDDDIG